MGGDFIVKGDGNITMTYCSKTPSDRPSVDHLLSQLKVSFNHLCCRLNIILTAIK